MSYIVGRVAAWLQARVWIAVALLPVTAAHAAWDRVDLVDGASGESYRPGQIAADAAGFWVAGQAHLPDLATGPGRRVLVRYGNDGQPRGMVYADGQERVAIPADGGLFSAGTTVENQFDSCVLERRDIEGRRLWYATLDDHRGCLTSIPDAHGGAWVVIGDAWSGQLQLRRVDRTGVVRARVDSVYGLSLTGVHFVAAPQDAVLYGVGTRAGSQVGSALFALKPDGGLLWERSLESLAFAPGGVEVAVDDEGAVYVVGRGMDSDQGRIRIAAFNPDGAPRFTASYNVADLNQPEAAAGSPAGVQVLASRDAGQAATRAALLRVSRDGLQQALIDIDQHPAWRNGDGVLIRTPDGASVAFVASSADTPPTLSLIKVDAEGQVTRAPLGRGSPAGLALLSHGQAVAAVRDTVTGSASLVSVATDSGTPQPLSLVSGRVSMQPLRTSATPRGDVYVLSREGRRGALTIERVAANGARVWRVRRAAGASGLGVLDIDANDRAVCFKGVRVSSTHTRLECLGVATGEPVFERSFEDGLRTVDSVMRVLPDGGVAQLHRAGGANGVTRHVRITPEGSVRLDVEIAVTPIALDITADGRGFVLGYVGPGGDRLRTIGLAADGTTVFNQAHADLPTEAFVEQGPDGSTLILGGVNSPAGSFVQAFLIGPDGRERWRDIRINEEGAAYADARFDGDSVIYVVGPHGYSYVDESHLVPPQPPFFGPARRVFAGRLALRDGTSQWQRTLPLSGYNIADVAWDARAGTMTVASSWPEQRIALTTLDVRSGETRGVRNEPCGTLRCGLQRLHRSDDGTLRAVAATANETNGRDARIFTLLAPSVTPPTRPELRHIGGHWYPETSPGEGLALAYVGSSSLIFGAWFTFSQAGGNDVSEQRWYTVRGTPAAGASEVELVLYENRNGQFSAPPTTAAFPVGRGTLRLEDCDTASLSYTFNDGYNEGLDGPATGTLTLTRLIASASDCGGSSNPPAIAVDPRRSGFWLDPAFLGQGLSLNEVPGLGWFGAWFTYDAGTPNDRNAQHWFTLQAASVDAANDTAQLVILQTQSGRFDRAPTRNTHVVGEATLRLSGCDRAVLEYRFDTHALAGAYAGRQGTLQIQHADGCKPP